MYIILSIYFKMTLGVVVCPCGETICVGFQLFWILKKTLHLNKHTYDDAYDSYYYSVVSMLCKVQRASDRILNAVFIYFDLG